MFFRCITKPLLTTKFWCSADASASEGGGHLPPEGRPAGDSWRVVPAMYNRMFHSVLRQIFPHDDPIVKLRSSQVDMENKKLENALDAADVPMYLFHRTTGDQSFFAGAAHHVRNNALCINVNMVVWHVVSTVFSHG